MLIYNSKKEFLGIDENDLKNLGYASFAQMRSEAADFADLFVKTPGFIHNFKHVHWIDFITYADSAETPQVIIHANEKTYKSNVSISTAFLIDNQDAKAYLVTLQNLRELTGNEINNFAADISSKPTQQPTHIIEDKPFIVEQEPTPKETLIQEPEVNLATDVKEETYSKELIEDEYDDLSLSAPLDIDFETDDEPEPISEVSTPIKDEKEKLELIEEIEDEFEEDILELEENKIPQELLEEDDEFISDYVYDPKIASDELGLPIDLIEEFIDDFVAQSKEFKDALYDSLNNGDTDNVKVLSHKLKGVAANLRIEDAFETLTTINTSSDINIIRKNINHFYIIVAKLAGEYVEPTTTKPAESTQVSQNLEIDKSEIIEEDDDELILDFKDEKLEIEDEAQSRISIEDSDVPQKIDVAELADDDFLDMKPLELDEDSLALDIETIDEEELSQDISIMEELPDDLELDLLDEKEKEEETTQDLDITQDEDEPLKEVKYDKPKIAHEIGIDEESFNELFEDYLLDANQLFLIMEDAIANDNPKLWKQETIKLKGMSDNMRVHTFTDELETLLSTSDTQEATKAAQHIKLYLSKLSTLEV